MTTVEETLKNWPFAKLLGVIFFSLHQCTLEMKLKLVILEANPIQCPCVRTVQSQ